MNDATKRVAEGWGFNDLDEIEELLSEEVDVGFLALLLLIDVNNNLTILDRKVDKIMADLSGLEAAVAEIGKQDAEAAQALDSLRQQVSELTAGTISQDQIDGLASSLNTASTALAAAITPATTEPGQPEEPTPPAEEGA